MWEGIVKLVHCPHTSRRCGRRRIVCRHCTQDVSSQCQYREKCHLTHGYRLVSNVCGVHMWLIYHWSGVQIGHHNGQTNGHSQEYSHGTLVAHYMVISLDGIVV